MNLIDLHCDTALKLMDSQGRENLKENSFSVSLNELRKADAIAQFFACFVYMEQFHGEDRAAQGYAYAEKIISHMKREVEHFKDEAAFAGNFEELTANREAGKLSAVLTIEEGGIIGRDLSRLEHLYDEGIRLVTLLWNFENEIGFPNSRDASVMQSGLKPFGFEVVERMNSLGMIVDVSHLSDGGFWDVIRHSKAPVMASHSNARALCPHPRNLTDEMLKALGEQGGVAGVNFYPAFVREDHIADASDLARHIRHMVNAAGIEAVAVGTDFDGFGDGETEITKSGQIGLLCDALRKEGFTSGQIEKIWSENALRVMREVL